MKNQFNFKSVRTKILFGFLFVILLIILLGAYNYSVIKKSNDEAKNIMEKELPLLIANEQMAITMANRISTARAYVLYGGDYKERFNDYTEMGKHNEAIVREIGASEEFDHLVKKTVEWRTFVEKEVFNEYDKGNKELARQNLAQKNEDVREIMYGYEEEAQNSQNLIMEAEKVIVQNGKRSVLITVSITVLIILVSLSAALITSHIITKPIIKVKERMKLISSGDLSNEPLETNSQDEIGQLVVMTNEMSHNLRELLNEINIASDSITSESKGLTQSASEVSTGSQQIVTTMQELAAVTESEASTASELASIMGGFAISIQEANNNGENIQKASNEVLHMTSEGRQLMSTSNKQMAKIDQIVHDAVQNMQELDAKSREISKLISIIREVSEQTNLLALNAAIEAARAGEHGKGFAVVADEVRKLAEQVSISVADITNIVVSIQDESNLVSVSLQNGYKEVQQGTIQIEKTQETFSGINSAITDMTSNIKVVSENLSSISLNSKKINESISEIAAISEESAAGVEQTSASSQQISSAMEEVSNSSDDLAKLAAKLNGLVHQFKL